MPDENPVTGTYLDHIMASLASGGELEIPAAEGRPPAAAAMRLST